MTDTSIANTILSQLGGQRFLAMTGARDLVSRERGLTMRLPHARYEGKRVSGLWINLTAADTYTLEAVRFNRQAMRHDIIARQTDVYAESLPSVFRGLTGLATAL